MVAPVVMRPAFDESVFVVLQTNGLKPALGQSVRTGTATTTATTTTPIANTIEKPPTETKRTNDEIKIPPPAKSSAVTPRIQDVATTEQTKKDDANKENTNLEPGKRERTVVMKPEAEAGVGRKELRKEDKEEDSKEAIRKNERKEEAVKKEEVETEDKSSDNEVGLYSHEGVTLTTWLLAVVSSLVEILFPSVWTMNLVWCKLL